MKGLPHANAFVVQFRSIDEPDVGCFSGRIEHVASGRTAVFQTVAELPQILVRMLKAVTSEKSKSDRMNACAEDLSDHRNRNAK